MPRNREQNEEIRRQRQETIIRGALKVYVEKGYAAAEINDVAEQAGVARGLIYYYFKDKRSLFRSLYTYMLDQSRIHVQNHFDREGSIREKLERFAFSMFHNVLEYSEGVLFFMRMRHDIHELFSADELKKLTLHGEFIQVIQNTLEKGMESGEIRHMSAKLLALQYWGSVIHGVMYFRQLNQELKDQGKSKDEIAQLIESDIHAAVAGSISLVTLKPVDNIRGDVKR